MNIDNLIKETLSFTDLEIEQDEYTGDEDRYIIYVYEDEAPESFGDNRVTADTVYLQIQLITPKDFEYNSLKNRIRDALRAADFYVTSIRSFLGSVYVGTEKIRQTVFEVNYTILGTEE